MRRLLLDDSLDLLFLKYAPLEWIRNFQSLKALFAFETTNKSWKFYQQTSINQSSFAIRRQWQATRCSKYKQASKNILYILVYWFKNLYCVCYIKSNYPQWRSIVAKNNLKIRRRQIPHNLKDTQDFPMNSRQKKGSDDFEKEKNWYINHFFLPQRVLSVTQARFFALNEWIKGNRCNASLKPLLFLYRMRNLTAFRVGRVASR